MKQSRPVRTVTTQHIDYRSTFSALNTQQEGLDLLTMPLKDTKHEKFWRECSTHLMCVHIYIWLGGVVFSIFNINAVVNKEDKIYNKPFDT